MSHLTASLIVLGWLALQVPIGTVVGGRLRQNQPQGGHQMNAMAPPVRGVLPPEQCSCGGPRTAGHQCTGGAR